MDEQRAWLRARRKRRLRIFAVMICLCVLFTTYPDILVTLSVFATGKPEQTQVQYVSGFAKLPEEIREQTVPVGTTLSELTLPDTLKAVMSGHQSYEDGEKEPEDDVKEETGEDKGDAGDETAGDITDTGDNNGSTEESGEGEPSDTEQEDTETDSGTEDKDTETGDGEDVQPEDSGESGETDESTITDNEDETDTDNGEGGEGESAPSEEQDESEQASALSAEQQASADAQETYTVTMPEYLAENVISVQTLENTSAEEQEETQAEPEEEAVTIEGVAWQAEPEYSGSTEGIYIFTAVLPEGYVLAEGGG